MMSMRSIPYLTKEFEKKFRKNSIEQKIVAIEMNYGFAGVYDYDPRKYERLCKIAKKRGTLDDIDSLPRIARIRQHKEWLTIRCKKIKEDVYRIFVNGCKILDVHDPALEEFHEEKMNEGTNEDTTCQFEKLS